MSEEDKHFIKRYEELLNKGYCDCNEMNCIDNNSPRRILNIVKNLQNQLQQKENIIKEAREKLNTQLAFTSSYQLNYQSAMSIIEEAKSILDKENING